MDIVPLTLSRMKMTTVYSTLFPYILYSFVDSLLKVNVKKLGFHCEAHVSYFGYTHTVKLKSRILMSRSRKNTWRLCDWKTPIACHTMATSSYRLH